MTNSSALKVVSTNSSQSTVVENKTPATATGNELEVLLREMQATAMAFAESAIKDPSARSEYTSKILAARDEIIQLVKDKKITPHEGAQAANEIRNQILVLARSKLTDFGLAVSKDMKASGPPISFFENKYATAEFRRNFSELTQAEREVVWTKIIDAAGRSNPRVNTRVRWYGMAGRVLLVASLAFAVYNVSTAENKPRQAAKEEVTLAGGAAGGAAAGVAVVALVSNPAGWVVGVAMFVGAAVTAAGSSNIFDYFWPEK